MSNQNATHQTVRLSRGNHGSSEEGVCVMELASMLAGEPFSDAPDSVCPVVAAFMRTYNDGVHNSCRQDLYCFAAGAVGTADDGRLDSRRELCRQLVRSDPAPAWLRIVQRLRLGRWSDVAVASRAARTLASHPERHALR